MTNGSQRTGDSVAAAIDQYGTMVYRLAYARTRSTADADDIFQEVFLKLLTHAPAFQSDGHEKAWLIRATVNASVNLLKSAWRRLEGAPLPDSPTAPRASSGRVPRRCTPIAFRQIARRHSSVLL